MSPSMHGLSTAVTLPGFSAQRPRSRGLVLISPQGRGLPKGAKSFQSTGGTGGGPRTSRCVVGATGLPHAALATTHGFRLPGMPPSSLPRAVPSEKWVSIMLPASWAQGTN